MSTPRFSTGYFPLRNRFAMLVETHSWKDYPTRVRITRNAIVSVLSQVAAHGKEWRSWRCDADARATALAGADFPLSYKHHDKVQDDRVPRLRIHARPSEVSGGLMTHYDESKPQMWSVPLRDEVVPDFKVTAPARRLRGAGRACRMVAAKLKVHGISYKLIAADQMSAEVETFRATRPSSARSRSKVTRR
jgi:hypothetical protein